MLLFCTVDSPIQFGSNEGVAVLDIIRAAAHVVSDRYLAATPDDFLPSHPSHTAKIQSMRSSMAFDCSLKHFWQPLRPERPGARDSLLHGCARRPGVGKGSCFVCI